MVPVGDQCLPRLQVRLDGRQRGGLGQRPEPVPDAVLGHGLDQRRLGRGRVDHADRLPATVIDQQDRLEVGPGRAHQLQPVGHRAGHHVLVRQHDPLVRIPQLDGSQQAALQQVGLPGLLVDVDGRRVVAAQVALGLPGRQPGGRVLVATAGVVGLLAWQDQTDHIVRVELFQMGRAVRVDDVVRRAGHRGDVGHACGVEPDPAKRRDEQAPAGLVACRGCGGRGPGHGGNRTGMRRRV